LTREIFTHIHTHQANKHPFSPNSFIPNWYVGCVESFRVSCLENRKFSLLTGKKINIKF
jgi:hypothetical protein